MSGEKKIALLLTNSSKVTEVKIHKPKRSETTSSYKSYIKTSKYATTTSAQGD